METTVNTILRSIEAIEGIFVVLSNLFVLGLFYQEGIRGRMSNCHIISLMFSDVLQGLINVPAVIYLTLDLRVGDPSCFWTIWLATTSAFTQIFIIVTMTVDRYWAIVHTMHYQGTVTPEITYGLIAFSWTVGLGLGVCGLFFRETPDDPTQLCFMVEQMFNKHFSACVSLLFVLPSNFVIAVLYFKIYRVIIKALDNFSPTTPSKISKIRKIVVLTSSSSSSGSGTGDGTSSDDVEKTKLREYRTMVIITFIVVLYFIGWLPTVVLYILTKLNKLTATAFLTSAILNHLHSALNPFLYALNIRERKVAAKRLIKRIFCCCCSNA